MFLVTVICFISTSENQHCNSQLVPSSSHSAFVLLAWAAAPALPISPGSIVINALAVSPSQQAQPQAAPSGWSGAVTGGPVPLTGLSPFICLPRACSWASSWPDPPPSAPWDSGRVRSLLICDNNPSSKM